MPLTDLTLTNFRCFADYTLSFPPSQQLVVVGPNGHGKSSIVEALTLLALTRSPRTRSDGELIRTGETSASIVGQTAPRQAIRLVVTNEANRVTKQVNRFGTLVPLAELIGTVRVVTFAPEDVELFTGPPRLRRRLLDSLLLQAGGTSYAQTMATCYRALRQRNSLLSARLNQAALRDAITVWDLLFAESASAMIQARMELTRALETATQALLAEMKLPLTLRLKYHGTVPEPDRLAELLSARLERDQQLGSTSVGPHRDDFVVTVNDRPLTSASRGEQRAVVVAVKLAEYERLAAASPADNPPLFLVDDVFSELDPARRELIAEHLATRPCIVTAADESAIPSMLTDLARITL